MQGSPFHPGYVIGGSEVGLQNAEFVEYSIDHVDVRRHEYPEYECCPDSSYWPVVIYTLHLIRAKRSYLLKIFLPQVGQALA